MKLVVKLTEEDIVENLRGFLAAKGLFFDEKPVFILQKQDSSEEQVVVSINCDFGEPSKECPVCKKSVEIKKMEETAVQAKKSNRLTSSIPLDTELGELSEPPKEAVSSLDEGENSEDSSRNPSIHSLVMLSKRIEKEKRSTRPRLMAGESYKPPKM